MKAAPVYAALRRLGIPQVLVHTGQHYDPLLSDVFFADLGLPEPERNLAVGSGSHAAQTAALLLALEQVIIELKPSLVVVYGDVNSTLAAALVTAKLLVPLAHVEAGLRSFDDTMPEEVNRRVTDLLSDLLFTTSPEAAENLARAGVPAERVHFVGNPMVDTLLANLGRLDPAGCAGRLGLDGPYAVATLHRPGNVDDLPQARRMATMLRRIADELPVVVPLHPRGRPRLAEAGLESDARLQVTDPMGYLEFMSLVRGARVVVTDSGGIQEETTVLRVPCLTVRPNTERPITISHGTNRLATPEQVPGLVAEIVTGGATASASMPPLWDGRAGERIARVIQLRLEHASAHEGSSSDAQRIVP